MGYNGNVHGTSCKVGVKDVVTMGYNGHSGLRGYDKRQGVTMGCQVLGS